VLPKLYCDTLQIAPVFFLFLGHSHPALDPTHAYPDSPPLKPRERKASVLLQTLGKSQETAHQKYRAMQLRHPLYYCLHFVTHWSCQGKVEVIGRDKKENFNHRAPRALLSLLSATPPSPSESVKHILLVGCPLGYTRRRPRRSGTLDSPVQCCAPQLKRAPST
jgi:hypothetical protein